MPDVDDGCLCGSIGVEEGFDGRSGGFNINSLELSVGVPKELASVSIVRRPPSFLLSTLDAPYSPPGFLV